MLPCSVAVRKYRGAGRVFLYGILAVLLICAYIGPVCGAGEEFIRSEPSLYATLSGTNEFYPGLISGSTLLLKIRGWTLLPYGNGNTRPSPSIRRQHWVLLQGLMSQVHLLLCTRNRILSVISLPV